jgi:hypothetical protein
LLIVMSLGLIGYGIFRLFSAWVNLDGKKNDVRGKLERAGQALSGFIHIALAWLALRLALDPSTSAGSGGSSSKFVEGLPGGWALLALAGALMVAGGFGNFLEAWSAKFRKMLGAGAPGWAEHAGRAGYAARGAVFVVIGWQLISAAFGSAGEQPGTESALEDLSSRTWLFYTVAGGLALFGAFNLLLAAYATIRDEDVVGRLKDALHSS